MCGPPKMRFEERHGCGVGWEMARVPRESTDCRARTVTVCHVAGFYGLPRFRMPQPSPGVDVFLAKPAKKRHYGRLGCGVGLEVARVPRDSTDCRARTVAVCHVAGFYGL